MDKLTVPAKAPKGKPQNKMTKPGGYDVRTCIKCGTAKKGTAGEGKTTATKRHTL